MVKWLFLAVPWGCLRFVIVVFPDHTHLLFFICQKHGHQGAWLIATKSSLKHLIRIFKRNAEISLDDLRFSSAK